jgi:hypothetical protein
MNVRKEEVKAAILCVVAFIAGLFVMWLIAGAPSPMNSRDFDTRPPVVTPATYSINPLANFARRSAK